MNLATSTVPAPYLPPLVDRLEARGTDCRGLAAAHGLDLQRLRQPGMRVSRDVVHDMLRQLRSASGRTDLGFEIGLTNQLRADDPVMHLLQSAATLGDALHELGRWFSLVTPSYRLGITPDGEALHLKAVPATPVPYDLGTLSLECIAVNLHRLLCILAHDRQFQCVMALSWSRPPHVHRYAELRGAQVLFDRGEPLTVTITVPEAALQMPMPLANTDAFEQALRACESQHRLWSNACRWTDWVKAATAASEGTHLTQDQMAALLNVSGRTLARRLQDEGFTYREVVQAARHDKALHLLRHSSLSVCEVAHLVGYGDAANFGHAFKQAAGLTPGQYRALFDQH